MTAASLPLRTRQLLVNRSRLTRWLVLLAFLASVAGFYGFGLQHQFSLEALQARQTELDRYRQLHPLGTAAAFFLVYVAIAALSLPFATPLALAGGAAFGLLEGVVLVSFASSIGATLAFLASRFLFHDLVQRHFGSRLQAVNEGLQRDGAIYLLALRLVPAVPFFLVNVLMGVTPIRVRTFYLVSQLGMLVGTLVYVNAGSQLTTLQSVSGILSLKLLGSLGLIAASPLLMRTVVARVTMYRRHRDGRGRGTSIAP